MPAPVLDTFAQEVYDRLAPMAFAEAQNGWALAVYCAAAGVMFQPVEDYGRDGPNGEPGWSVLLDINRCPAEGLGFLAQLVGVTLQAGLSDAAQRARIKSTDGWRRGTPGAIIGAAQQYLSGAKTVVLRERDGDPYRLTVITYTSQTPDSAKVLAALLAQKPAGIVLNYQVLTGQDYTSLLANHPTYANVNSTYLTYQGIVTDQPGT